MGACYPFLPALLRSPFRLRDNLINFGSSDPPQSFVSFGRGVRPSSGQQPLEISEFNVDAIAGRLQVPCG